MNKEPIHIDGITPERLRRLRELEAAALNATGQYQIESATSRFQSAIFEHAESFLTMAERQFAPAPHVTVTAEDARLMQRHLMDGSTHSLIDQAIAHFLAAVEALPPLP